MPDSDGSEKEQRNRGVSAALSPEEWEHKVVWFRGPFMKPAERQSPVEYNRQSVGSDGSYGVDVEDGYMFVWDDSWALTISNDTRHALAALALHGQPYGFTRRDVGALRFIVKWGEADPQACERLASLADRIEALLPPLEET